MGEPVETVAPTAEVRQPEDWYVRLIRKKDQRKYFIHRNGQTTARCDHIMLLPEEVAKQLAAALRKNHPDFTAVAKKCPKRFLHPVQGKRKARKPEGPVLSHAMEDLKGLLLCPFCGGQPFLSITCDDRGKWFAVRCSGCNVQSEDKATKEAAIKRWNRRVKPTN